MSNPLICGGDKAGLFVAGGSPLAIRPEPRVHMKITPAGRILDADGGDVTDDDAACAALLRRWAATLKRGE